MPVDVVTSRGAKKNRCACEIAGLAPSAGWDALKNLPAPLRIVSQCLRVIRGHVTWRNRVDVDALRRSLIGERFGELGHSTCPASCEGGTPPGDLPRSVHPNRPGESQRRVLAG